MNAATPRATIVIPQHGRSELTFDCIASFREHEADDVPIVVVDDGSPPGTSSALRLQTLPRVRVVEQPHRGVTAAWNRGAAESASSVLVFLNNDTLSRGPWLARLLELLEDAETICAGVRLREERLLPQAVLERLPSRRFVEGWCMAVRTEDFHSVGGFDERMRRYWSDTDLQCRLLASKRAGEAALRSLPSLPMVHLGHRTACGMPDRSAVWRTDRARFLARWGSATASDHTPPSHAVVAAMAGTMRHRTAGGR